MSTLTVPLCPDPSLFRSRRGRIALDRFGIRTLFPFELFRAWAWLHMDLQGLVYPSPADNVPEPPPTQSAHGHRQHDARGEDDFEIGRASSRERVCQYVLISVAPE